MRIQEYSGSGSKILLPALHVYTRGTTPFKFRHWSAQDARAKIRQLSIYPPHDILRIGLEARTLEIVISRPPMRSMPDHSNSCRRRPLVLLPFLNPTSVLPRRARARTHTHAGLVVCPPELARPLRTLRITPASQCVGALPICRGRAGHIVILAHLCALSTRGLSASRMCKGREAAMNYGAMYAIILFLSGSPFDDDDA